jgi:hypothetical protein
MLRHAPQQSGRNQKMVKQRWSDRSLALLPLREECGDSDLFQALGWGMTPRK